MSKLAEIQTILGVTADGIWGAKSQAALDLLTKTPDLVQPATTGGVDARSQKNIDTLVPKVQALAIALVQKCATAGITIVVTSGTRTFAEQDALFAQGGVTKARGGQSNHNYGLAFDVTIFESGKPVWESPVYRSVGTIGKSLGLSWGGDWKSIVDEPHFELRPAWATSMPEGAMISELRRRHAIGQDYFS